MNKNASFAMTAKYLAAQEKRASVEMGEFLRGMSDDTTSELANLLSKRADSAEVMQYIRDLMSSAKQQGSNLVSRIPEGARYLGETAKKPLGGAAIGGATGALAGAGAGLASGNNIAGKALQGGVAGAAIGGGGSLVYNALKNRSMGDTGTADAVTQLTDAIGRADDNQGTNYGMKATGVGLAAKGINVADNAISARSPAATLMGEDVSNLSNRMNLIKRLEDWGGGFPDKGPQRLGQGSVKSFAELLQQVDSPDGTKQVMRALADAADSSGIPGANSTLQNLFSTHNIATTPDASVDSIVRALQESKPTGFNLAPSNMADRIRRLAGRGIGQGPVSVATDRLGSALGSTRLRGRAGLAVPALAALGFGADAYNGMQQPAGQASAEDIQALREQLNLQ